MNKIRLVLFPVFLLTGMTAGANVRLPRIFGPDMVLQQGRRNLVWGWADSAESVELAFAGITCHTVAAADGKWQCYLPPMGYGGPYSMIVKGRNTITLTGILIGEVWLCSGQSNMEMTVDAAMNAKKEIDSAQYPAIRLFTVAKRNAQFPRDDLDEGQWMVCSPATVAKFSAVGYFFGRALHSRLQVPIGLINSAFGGTLIEAWTSGETMRDDPDFKEPLKQLLAMDLKKERENRVAAIRTLLGSFPEKDSSVVNGVDVYAAPDYNDSGWSTIGVPGYWGNNGYPGINGVGWYRTEFTLTKAEADSGITLHLDNIYHGDSTWVNGQWVGSMNPSNDQRIYAVNPGGLKTGRNVLAVKVFSENGNAGIAGSAANLFIQTAGKKIALSGGWRFKISKVVLNDITTFRNGYPTMLYNGMIHPLVPFGIRGVIWYQGESNAAAGRSGQYRRLFPELIADWRKHWHEADLPFLFVSLANYGLPVDTPAESEWAALREAQTMTLNLPHTGMVVAIDDGDAAMNIHPKNKQLIGSRLAMTALKIAYGQPIVAEGPRFQSMTITGGQVRVRLDQTGSGLTVKDRYGYIKGFCLCGGDRVFHWARAWLVDSRTVVVSCSEVARPVAVSYGWADNPDDLDLYNKEGFPAIPFRTDGGLPLNR